MGNTFEKEVKECLRTRNLPQLRQLFDDPKNSTEANAYNFFKFVLFDDEKHTLYDSISYALTGTSKDRNNNKTSDLELLKFFKERIEKNPDKQQRNHPSTGNWYFLDYAKLVVTSAPSDLGTFRFLLDNYETFQMSSFSSSAGENSSDSSQQTILYTLVQSVESIELLREFLASGHLAKEFHNNNNNGGAMGKSGRFETETPLQEAVFCWNAEAARELISGNIGGKNYVSIMEMLFQMLVRSSEEKFGGARCPYESLVGVDIVLALLSQPGADKIRSHRMDGTLSRKLIRRQPKFRDDDQDVVSSSIYGLINAIPQKGDFKIPILLNDDFSLSFATAALWIGFPNLSETLISNNCSFWPKTKLFSQGLVDASRFGETAKVRKILVEYKLHKGVIDINRSLPCDDENNNNDNNNTNNIQYMPLTSAAENNHLEIVRMLLDAGADTEKTLSPNEMTALLWSCKIARTKSSEEITKLLVDRGAAINARTTHEKMSALDFLVSQHYLLYGRTVFNEVEEGITIDPRIQFLIDKGAKLYVLEKNRDESLVSSSSLHLAIKYRHVEAVKLLLAVADASLVVSLKDGDGRTARDLAEEKVNETKHQDASREIRKLILKRAQSSAKTEVKRFRFRSNQTIDIGQVD